MIGRRIGTACAATLSILLATAGAIPARAGSAPPDPVYEWIFAEYLSDGAGGFTGPNAVVIDSQPGGALDERHTLNTFGLDHLRVFAIEDAAHFLGTARAPIAESEDAGAVVGGRTELVVTKGFRKETADATLSFTIPASILAVRDFRFDSERSLLAAVKHTIEAGDFFLFSEEAFLEGFGGDWTFEEIGTGILPWELTSGALDSGVATFTFSEPFSQDVDLSGLAIGQEFNVTYRLRADAVDTSNNKSLALGAGFDGEHLNEGVSFEVTGLTPVPVPEAGAPLLLATGAAVLAAARRRTLRSA
jgi:hypothetical protein